MAATTTLRELLTTVRERSARPSPPWDRWDGLALAGSLVLAVALALFKLEAYYDLAYTDDLFMFLQLSTSWLDGRPFQDHHYGNNLGIHTHLLALPLGLIVRPLGAPGLMVL